MTVLDAESTITHSDSLWSLVNRYYDPATGQFVSVDPDVAETGQPYAGFGDNPVNATDPLGLCNGPDGICTNQNTGQMNLNSSDDSSDRSPPGTSPIVQRAAYTPYIADGASSCASTRPGLGHRTSPLPSEPCAAPSPYFTRSERPTPEPTRRAPQHDHDRRCDLARSGAIRTRPLDPIGLTLGLQLYSAG
jgi:RHS repeat-associated protein